MNKGNKRFVPILLLAAAVGLAGCTASGAAPSEPAAAQNPEKTSEPAAPAKAGFSGKIIPGQTIKIVSKISGKVAAVNVAEGDRVKQGDPLVQLESEDLEEQVKQAEAGVIAAQAKLDDTLSGPRAQELRALESAVQAAQGAKEQAAAAVRQAEARLELSTKMYNRLRNMYDTNSSVTREDLDKGTLEYESAQAGYEQAQAALKAAEAQVAAAAAKLELTQAGPTENTVKALQADVDRLTASVALAVSNLKNASIVAPADGMIVTKNISPGEMAQPGVQIVSLVNMDQVEVELSVADQQIGQVKAGAPVTVKVPNAGDRTFKGTVAFVSPVSNPNSSTFPVKVRVDNPEGVLLAGMIAEVYVDDNGQSGQEVPK